VIVNVRSLLNAEVGTDIRLESDVGGGINFGVCEGKVSYEEKVP